jgi:hypothetical protein
MESTSAILPSPWTRWLLLVFVVAVLGGRWLSEADGPVSSVDEGAWIFSSYVFHLTFLEQNFDQGTWRTEDTLDHPPVARYLFGAVAATTGFIESSAADKEWWARRGADVLDIAGFQQEIDARIPRPALSACRMATTLAMIAAAMLLFALVAGAWSQAAGAFAAAAFVLHPRVLHMAVQATSDPFFVALLLANLVVLGRVVIGFWRTGRLSIATTVALGILSALHFSTKINGSISLVINLIALAIAAVLPGAAPEAKGVKVRIYRAIRAGVLMTLVFIAVAVGVNPSLWHDPLGFLADMVRFRLQLIELQSTVFLGDALPALDLRFGVLARRLLFDEDPVLGAVRFPLLLIGVSLGMVAAVRRMRDHPQLWLVPLLGSVFWIGATVVTYRLDWQHYRLPAVPFIVLLALLGLGELFPLRHGPSMRRRLRDLGLATAIAAILVCMAVTRTMESWVEDNPEWMARARLGQIEVLARRHPQRPDIEAERTRRQAEFDAVFRDAAP